MDNTGYESNSNPKVRSLSRTDLVMSRGRYIHPDDIAWVSLHAIFQKVTHD